MEVPVIRVTFEGYTRYPDLSFSVPAIPLMIADDIGTCPASRTNQGKCRGGDEQSQFHGSAAQNSSSLRRTNDALTLPVPGQDYYNSVSVSWGRQDGPARMRNWDGLRYRAPF